MNRAGAGRRHPPGLFPEAFSARARAEVEPPAAEWLWPMFHAYSTAATAAIPSNAGRA